MATKENNTNAIISSALLLQFLSFLNNIKHRVCVCQQQLLFFIFWRGKDGHEVEEYWSESSAKEMAKVSSEYPVFHLGFFFVILDELKNTR